MVNLDGFREYLEKANMEEDKINKAIIMVDELLIFLNIDESINELTIDDVFNFSKFLIEKEMNNYDNYILLYRYGLFSKSENLVIGILEIIDGSEMLPNFSKRLTEEYGQ
jgi:hypothetical protein